MSSEVSWADQQQINEFSKLNTRLTQHEKAIERLEQDKEILDDAQMELELVDEDELLSYRLGDSFVMLPQAKVMERLEQDGNEIDDKIAARRKEAEEVTSRMDELKTNLYARFGDSINLERS